MADGFGAFLQAAETGVRSFQRTRTGQMQNLIRQSELERRKAEHDRKAALEMEKKAAKQRVQAVADQIGNMLWSPTAILDYKRGGGYLPDDRRLEALAAIAAIADDDPSTANSLASMVNGVWAKPKVKTPQERAAELKNEVEAKRQAYEQITGRKLSQAQIDDLFGFPQAEDEEKKQAAAEQKQLESLALDFLKDKKLNQYGEKTDESLYTPQEAVEKARELQQILKGTARPSPETQAAAGLRREMVEGGVPAGEPPAAAVPSLAAPQAEPPPLFQPAETEPVLPVLGEEEPPIQPALAPPQEPETEDDVRDWIGRIGQTSYKQDRNFGQTAVRKGLLTQAAYDSLHNRNIKAAYPRENANRR